MNEPRALLRCPACGLTLPQNRLAGLCPACAWEGLSHIEGDPDGDGDENAAAADMNGGTNRTHAGHGNGHEERQPSAGFAGAAVGLRGGAPQRTMMRVPGYEILAEVARGGMGIVYRARQLDPPRTVALKMLLPHQLGSSGGVDRFRVEIQALTELEHPAILPVYEAGEYEGLPYFTMKLASGGTLAERKTQFAGDWRAIAELMARLADAVQFAHEHAVLHRDLKPGNVLFDEAGRMYVSDFGLAKMVSSESDLTRSVDVLGTPHYVAPEVAAHSARQATTASDVYSLGAILYELLTGFPPFAADGIPALLRKIAEEDPVPPSSRGPARAAPGDAPTTKLPRDLEIICLKCLAKDPMARYASAREFAEDLRRWLGGKNILARPATHLERLCAWMRRNPALATLAILLFLVLAVAIGLQARTNVRLRNALGESLLAQARLERSSSRAGQRFNTELLIGQATKYHAAGRDASAPDAARLAALRTELVAALALPDVRPLSRWPVPVTHFENSFDFTPDLEQYVAPMTNGGFALCSTATRQPIWQMPAITNNAPIELRVSAKGKWVAARFQNGNVELYRTSTNVPFRTWSDDPAAQVPFAFDSSGQAFAVAAPPERASAARTSGSTRPPTFSHKGAPSNSAASGDTRNIAAAATARFSYPVEVWDLTTGSLRARIPQTKRVTAVVARLGDGGAPGIGDDRIAIASDKLDVWRLSDTKLIWSAPLAQGASAVAWSPDGRRVAAALDRRMTGTADGEASKGDPVVIFNAASGRQESVFTEARSRVQRLAFHPDGQSLAAVSWDQQLVWGGVQPDSFRLTTEASQRALVFASDGHRIGYNPTREELGLMEIVPPRMMREWQMPGVPSRDAFSLAVSSDGRWAATATDSRVHLWETERGVETAVLDVPDRPWWITVLFAPRDEFLYYSAFAFGVHRVELLRRTTGQGKPTLEFGRDEVMAAPALPASGTGRLQPSSEHSSPPRNTAVLPTSTGFSAIGFASDGRSLIVGQNRRRTQNDNVPPTMWLWPDADPSRARRLTENFRLVGYRTIPGGKWGISTDLVTPDLWIWDFQTGERKHHLGIPLPVGSEPTANGRWLLTRTTDEMAVWEVGAWRKLFHWRGRPEEQGSTTIVSSPDSRMATTKASDGRIILRALPEGTELLTLTPPHAFQITDWQFSPDGRRIFILRRNGRMYDWNLAELRTELAKKRLDW